MNAQNPTALGEAGRSNLGLPPDSRSDGHIAKEMVPGKNHLLVRQTKICVQYRNEAEMEAVLAEKLWLAIFELSSVCVRFAANEISFVKEYVAPAPNT